MAKATLGDLGDLIWDAIEKWDTEVDKQLIDAINEVSKSTKDVIKQGTPKRRRSKGKNFVNCYKVTPKNNTKGYTRIVHNEKYQLAHLLEDGHKVYTRLGKKIDPSAVKTGPYDVKKIWAKDKNHIVQKPELTSRYDMWYKGRKYAKDELFNNVVKRLEAIGKL